MARGLTSARPATIAPSLAPSKIGVGIVGGWVWRRDYTRLSKQIAKGDKIMRIDDRDIVGLWTSDLGGLLVGPVGTAVSLQILRGHVWKGGKGKA